MMQETQVDGPVRREDLALRAEHLDLLRCLVLASAAGLEPPGLDIVSDLKAAGLAVYQGAGRWGAAPAVLGEYIRRRRAALSLTVRDVATRAGCTPGYISKVELHGEIPAVDVLTALARTLRAPHVREVARLAFLQRAVSDFDRRYPASEASPAPSPAPAEDLP